MPSLIERFSRWARRRRLVRQYDRVDCGPAALLSVLRFHGGDSSLVWVRDLAGTDAHGTTMFGLLQAAQALGFKAHPATGTLDELAREPLPAIAHIVTEERRTHFVVVYEVSDVSVLVGDPGRGLHRERRDSFEARWARKAVILLTPTEALARTKPPHWLRWILAYFRQEETWLLQSLFLGVAYTLLGLLTSVFVQWLIDRFIPEADVSKIVATGAVLIGLQVIRALAGFLRQRFTVELNRRINVRVNEAFLLHLFQLPMRFFDTRKTGDITARIHDGVRIQSAILLILGTTMIDGLIIVGSLAFMFALAPPLAWIALAAVPVYATLLLLATRRIKGEQRETMQGYAMAEASYIDSLGGIDEIRTHGTGEPFARLNTLLFRNFQEKSQRLGFTQAAVGLQSELAGGILAMATLIYGSLLVIGQQLQLGEMIAAYSLLAGVLPSTSRLVEANIALQGASVAATRLMDLLLIGTEPVTGTLPFRLKRGVHFRNVHFAWPRGQRLIDGVGMSVEVGRITALWGLSGAGKSTLVKLLERKYPLAGGDLLVDDIPAADVELGEYRRNVSVLPETVKIFNGTLADNILVGREISGPDELMERIEALGLESILSRFEAGLFTIVGEDGRQLSSGERQLVGLIRALLLRPRVLVVDEGINAVDVEASALVFSTLARHARENAVLLISHNLRTLLRSDYLYLLESGRITEEGEANSLLEEDGRFAQLWRLQEGSLATAVA